MKAVRSHRAHHPIPARSGHRFAAAFAAAVVLVMAVPAGSASAQSGAESSEPLTLQRSFFKGTKFIYRGGEPQKMNGFVSYTTEFTDLLAMHPAALDEANRANPYRVTSLLGSVGMLAVSLKIFIETLNDASDVREGRIDANTGTTSLTDVAVLAGFGALTVFSGIKANGHVKGAVRIFNEAETGAGDRPSAPGRPDIGLGLTSLDGHRTLVWRLAFRM